MRKKSTAAVLPFELKEVDRLPLDIRAKALCLREMIEHTLTIGLDLQAHARERLPKNSNARENIQEIVSIVNSTRNQGLYYLALALSEDTDHAMDVEGVYRKTPTPTPKKTEIG